MKEKNRENKDSMREPVNIINLLTKLNDKTTDIEKQDQFQKEL